VSGAKQSPNITVDMIKNHSLNIGFSFGLTSSIITTLGLMVGLYSGTHSKPVVIGGILTIAIADAFSDALGIHISEESENRHTVKEIWMATVATFFSKFLFSLTFIIPVLLFKLLVAMIVSMAWGLSGLCLLSYTMARTQKTNPVRVIAEHLSIAAIVIILTHYVGRWISLTFG